MKCLKTLKPGEIVICEKEMPVPKKGEALLKLLYGGICGSDLSTYKGTFIYASYPRIPGHEVSCEIVDVGENEYGLKKGMVVTINPYFNCNNCYSCSRGFVNCCENNETMGAQREGAFCEYITMPVERIYDGKGVDPMLLALAEPYSIGWHSVNRACPKPDEKILITGAGSVGMFALKAAKRFGAKVFVSDISETRLERALKAGADGAILIGTDDLMKKTDEITNKAGFDICIEAAGLPSTFLDCIDCAAYRGRIVVLGISSKEVDFKFTLIQKKELNIFGSRNSLKEDFISVIDFIKNDEKDLQGLISEVYDFNDAANAFSGLVSGSIEQKALIRF